MADKRGWTHNTYMHTHAVTAQPMSNCGGHWMSRSCKVTHTHTHIHPPPTHTQSLTHPHPHTNTYKHTHTQSDAGFPHTPTGWPHIGHFICPILWQGAWLLFIGHSAELNYFATAHQNRVIFKSMNYFAFNQVWFIFPITYTTLHPNQFYMSKRYNKTWTDRSEFWMTKAIFLVLSYCTLGKSPNLAILALNSLIWHRWWM